MREEPTNYLILKIFVVRRAISQFAHDNMETLQLQCSNYLMRQGLGLSSHNGVVRGERERERILFIYRVGAEGYCD